MQGRRSFDDENHHVSVEARSVGDWTPYGYHDPDLIRADLQAAAFESISIVPVEAVSTAHSPGEAAMAYCQGTPLRAEIEARGGSLEETTRIAAMAIAKRFGSGAVRGRIQALVVMAF